MVGRSILHPALRQLPSPDLFVGCCIVRLRIPGSRSLKDKRQVLRSLLQRIKNKFDVAVAEIGDNNAWQITTIGVVSVSNQSHHAGETIDAVIAFIEDSRPDCEVVGRSVEVHHFED